MYFDTIFSELDIKIKALPRPAGVSYIFGGDMENQSEGFGTLGIALLMSIILIYLIMVALYNNYIHPSLYCSPFRFQLLKLACTGTNKQFA